jgi:galactoside O-acetyltransferase
MSSFLSESELAEMGFKSVGSNVLISRKASFYGADKMSIGSNVRIDDFCILSGTITLGNNIHIAAYSAIYGANGVVMEDYTGLSPRCTIFSAMDDFGGDYLISPMSKSEYTNVQGGLVAIKRYSQIGSGTTIFPNLTVGEGVAVGAMSLVCSNLNDWGIYFGIPAKYQKPRSKGLLKFVSNEE